MHMEGNQWEIFRFENLPSISREEIMLREMVNEVLSEELITEELLESLGTYLAPYIHSKLSWNLVGQSQFLTGEQIGKLTLPPFLILQLRILPMDQFCFVEFPPKIAATIVDKALGGSGEGIPHGKPLTSAEEGVFSYIVLKVFQYLRDQWGDVFPFDFRLERMWNDFDAFEKHVSFSQKFFFRSELQFALDGEHHFTRFHLPVSFFKKVQEQSKPQEQTEEQEWEIFQHRFSRIEHVRAFGSVRVGKVELSEQDIWGLEPEDIILLRECTVSLGEDALLHGHAIIKYGEYGGYAFKCSLLPDPMSAHVQIRLDEIVYVGAPHPKGSVDKREIEEMPGENSNEYEIDDQDVMSSKQMSSVAGSLPVSMVVELGRIESSAREIVGLRLGQIIELNRSPYEPLDLVVNGQLLGQGQLVEIDGQIGLKIVKLYR